MADAKSADTGADNPFGIPNFDLRQLLEPHLPPGLDLGKLLERERDSIEAVRQANQALMEGWSELAEKQARIFRESLEQWQKVVQDGLSGDSPTVEQQADLARRGFEQALENMREMAEIAAQSQSRAYEIMRNRIEENVKAYFSAGQDRKE
jgi:phasin family protein